MRRACIFLTAALLVFAGSAARAQDKPTGGGASSEPGAPPDGTLPAPSGTVDVEKIVLRVNDKVVESAPPGVTVEVTIGLKNFSSKDATNVKLHLDASQGGRITDADATYGDIAAGDGADGVFSLVIDRDPCPEFYGIGGELSFDGGTSPVKVAIATACPGPRLSIQEVRFTGGDGDGIPEPGETVRAFVILRNDGHDAATNVRATVKVSGKGVTSTTDTLAWPDIAPGASEKSTAGLVVTISDDAPQQEGCPPLPGGGGGVVIPPEEGGSASDTPVSSDGSVGSGGNVSSQPGSSSPGSAGTGSEPAQTEPAPPSTAEPNPQTTSTTIEPQPIATGEPAPPPGTGTIEPDPGTPEPQPAPRTTEPAPDRPALVQLQMDVSATGYTATVEYSNQTVCALEEGVPALATDSVGKRDSGGASSSALPIAMVIVLVFGAVAARFALIR